MTWQLRGVSVRERPGRRPRRPGSLVINFEGHSQPELPTPFENPKRAMRDRYFRLGIVFLWAAP
jgi:hypothetical protein